MSNLIHLPARGKVRSPQSDVIADCLALCGAYSHAGIEIDLRPPGLPAGEWLVKGAIMEVGEKVWCVLGDDSRTSAGGLAPHPDDMLFLNPGDRLTAERFEVLPNSTGKPQDQRLRLTLSLNGAAGAPALGTLVTHPDHIPSPSRRVSERLRMGTITRIEKRIEGVRNVDPVLYEAARVAKDRLDRHIAELVQTAKDQPGKIVESIGTALMMVAEDAALFGFHGALLEDEKGRLAAKAEAESLRAPRARGGRRSGERVQNAAIKAWQGAALPLARLIRAKNPRLGQGRLAKELRSQLIAAGHRPPDTDEAIAGVIRTWERAGDLPAGPGVRKLA